MDDINKLVRHATTVAKLTSHTNSSTTDGHALDIKYDGNSTKTSGSSRHTPTFMVDPRSTHNDLPNRTMSEDDVVLASEVFLM